MAEYQNREDIDKLLNLVEDIKYLIGYDENKVLATSDDVKEAINSLNQLINDEHYDKSTIDSLNDDLTDNITSLNDVVTSLLFRLGLSQDNNSYINFALLNRKEGDVENIEFWILANAYYNYDDGYFYKMNMDNTSFGIQIQAIGTIFGEAELGYTDNSGIVVWRNPSLENLSWATAEQKRCLVERHIIGEYDADENIETFYKSCGWNNAFLFDSYGGMTVGGTGFEIDGNGIFPYTRVANCLYTDENDVEYGYIALLHNAYNSTRYGWDCDSNRTYSWMMGIHAPVDTTLGGNNLDMTQADFRVMYNDTPYNDENTHELDISNWKIILKADLNTIQGMVGGSLTTLDNYVHPATKQCNYEYVHPTTKQCNYSYTHPTTKQCNYSYTHPTTKQCNYSPDLSNYVTNTQLSDAISDVTSETGSIYLTKTSANSTYLSKTDAQSTYLKKTDAQSTYLTQSNANTTYLKKTDANTTYLKKTDAQSTYLTQSDANTTYLKKTDAQSTYAPIDHSSTNKTYGGATSTKYGHVKLSDTSVSDWQSSATAITPSGADDSIGVSESALYDVYHEFASQSKSTKNGHVHTTDEVRLAGTQYAITSMLNAMYSWYQQYSGQSPSWTGDSQNHVYVRDIIWDSTYQEYRITDDITDSIQPGTILILNVASTSANHYGGHDLVSFRNNNVSMWLMSNADMELSDYSTVMLIYNRGIANNTPLWIPILKDNNLCLNVDSSLVL